jgi:hypothetical protein
LLDGNLLVNYLLKRGLGFREIMWSWWLARSSPQQFHSFWSTVHFFSILQDSIEAQKIDRRCDNKDTDMGNFRSDM